LKKRIVFVSYSYWPPDFGGELLITIERLEYLMRRGYTVQVLTSGKPGMPVQQTWAESGHIWRSPIIHASRMGRLMRRIVFWFWALACLMSLDFDVLHVGSLAGLDSFSDALMARLMGWIARYKGARGVWVHSLADSDQAALDLRGWRGLAKRLFYESFDTLVSVSPFLHQSVCNIWPQKAVCLPCGVRDDLFVPVSPEARTEFRKTMGVSTEDVVFIFLGSVGIRKGFDLLAQAFNSISTVYPDWKLWVIGPRSQAENANLVNDQVVALTQNMEQNPCVNFLGRIDDRQQLAMLMSAGDVFVFPSRREGMGIAPIEAMSAGLPVIIARLPGITDLANIEGETGFYISPGNVLELQLAMTRLGESAALRQQMGFAARQRVLTSFGWKQHLEHWQQVYAGEYVE